MTRDLKGQVFNRLLVIDKAGRASNRSATWLCLCECGNSSIVRESNLLNKNTKSCGCLLIRQQCAPERLQYLSKIAQESRQQTNRAKKAARIKVLQMEKGTSLTPAEERQLIETFVKNNQVAK